jgi:ketosteroid isomerase-like protein
VADADSGAAAVLEFVNAFNDEYLERLAAVLDPKVVLHSARGTRRGIEEALAWARRIPTGELDQRIELESLHLDGDRAVAFVRKQWWWRQGALAREDEIAWSFELRDGRIASWEPFEDRAAALAEIGRVGS